MSSRVRPSLIRRGLYSLLALTVLVAGGVTYVAPAQPAAAAGAPIVIDDFSGNRLGTRTVTNHPQSDSTTSAGSFTESGGVGVVVAGGNGNTAAYTTLEYALPGATDLTAAGNNKQFFLEFNSIQRTPLPPAEVGDTAMHVGINLVDSAGGTGNFSTGIASTLGQNIVLNWECASGGVCFSGNADYTKITKITVTIAYPTNYDSQRSLRAELNIIRTTPLGGVQPPATTPYIAPVKTTVESTTAAPVEFVVAFTAWGSARSVSGLDASDFIVSGTATPLGTPVVTGGPSEYLVTIPAVATSGTVKLEAKPGAVTDTWGQASLAGSGPATSTFVLGVAPVITSALSGTAVIGNAFSATFTHSGNPAPVYTRTSGTLPSGITLSTAGVLAGTPAAGTAGTYTFSVKATNFAGSDTKTYVLTVNQKPAFTSSATATFTAGTAGSFTVTTGGTPAPAITRTGTLPSGLTFSDNGNGTATISGTAAAAAGSSYPLALTASNGVNPNATQTLTIVVNVAPAITTQPQSASVLLGDAATFTAAASGYPAPTVQWQRQSGASWANVAGATSATYSFTPTQADNGAVFRAVFTNSVSSATSDVASVTVKRAPAFTSDATTTFVVGDEGSFVVTADGIPAPAITHGTLPSWLTFTTNPNGSATISGTPPVSAAGTNVVVSLTSTNGVDPAATSTLTIVVRQKPVVTTSPLGLTVEPGTAVTLSAAASGFPLPSVQWQRSIDGGSTFTNLAGETQPTLAFTSDTAGNGHRYRAVFTNAVGSATTSAAIVRVGTAPSITSANSTRFTAGVAGSFTITATNAPTLSASALPTWLTLTNTGANTATLTGTAPRTSKGVHTFTLIGNNTFSPNASQIFSLTVEAAPLITSAASATFTVGEAGSRTIVTNAGFPFATSITVAGDLPDGVTFVDNGDGTATLAGTPAGGSGASYPLSISALAEGGSLAATTQEYALTVTEQAAFTSDDSAVLVLGDAATVTITTRPGFPAVSTITRTGSLPAGLTFTDLGDGTAQIVGTPTASGRFALELTVSNGVGTAPTQSFEIEVHARPSITSADAATFEVGAAGSFTVQSTAGFPVATSLDVDGDLPGGVTFTDNGDGTATLLGTPESGDGGSYPLTISALAVDGTLTAAAQSFTLTVLEQPAITSSDSRTLTAGVEATVTITSAAGFPVSRSIAVSGALPAGMAFTDLGDGTATIAGTPAVAAAGSYDLEITVDNGVGTAPVQQFVLVVNTQPQFTSAEETTFEVDAEGTFTVQATAGFPVATSIDLQGDLPAGVAFVDNGDGTATLAGTPEAGTGGTYPLTVEATAVGGTLDGTVQSFVLTVEEQSAFTSSAAATLTAGDAATVTIRTAAGFPASRTIALTGTLPSGLSFTDLGDGTATIEGTPAVASAGSYELVLAVDNGVGTAPTQAFTLDINTSPTFTSAATTTFVAGSAGSFTIETAAGFPVQRSLEASGDLPEGVTFVDAGDGTATLTGTPTAGSGGSYPLTISTSAEGDATAATTQQFVLEVTETAAITSADSATFALGAPASFTVTTAHGFPGNPSITVAGELPSGVTFVDNGDGTATLGGTATEAGSFALTLSSDNGRLNTQGFELVVTSAPVFTTGADASFTVGIGGSFSLATTPGNPTATVLTASELPEGLDFTDNGDGTGTITGAPAIGTAGSHPITVTASNGVGAGTQISGTIEISAAETVALPPTVPASNGVLGGVPEATTAGQTLTITGSGYAPGAPITLGMYSTPRALGTAIADSTGTFSARVTLPALTGEHTIVATGLSAAGAERFLTGVTVISPAAVDTEGVLVTTGVGGVEQALWLALLLLVVGFGLRSWGRARRA